MSQVTYTYSLTPGTPEDVSQVQQNFNDIRSVVNGSLDSSNLTLATNQYLGISDSSNVRRGYTGITTEEARTNTAYATLTTPDQVSNVVLPTNGLICVGYQAMWKESVAGAARAAIFVGATQLKVADQGAATPSTATTGGPEAVGVNCAVTGTYKPLASSTFGLYGDGSVANTAYTGDVTTGQLIGNRGTSGGGYVTLFAAAGTYTISVQYRATSGTVTAKNRNLWVWTLGF